MYYSRLQFYPLKVENLLHRVILEIFLSCEDFGMNPKISSVPTYWSHSSEELFTSLQSSPQGLSSAAAQDRLIKFGRNELLSHKKAAPLLLLLNQFKSPLVLILVFAAIISVITGEWIDASIILAIVIASAVLGFVQGYGASNAGTRAKVLRSR